MTPLSLFRNVIQQADFFKTSQLIRYQKDANYRTLTGGLFSLGIVAIVATIFFSMIIKAINRQNIDWTSQIVKETEPKRLSIPFSQNFIGIELEGINLSDSKQYFDVTLSLYQTFNKSQVPIITSFPLSQCKREDWNYGVDILDSFDKMGGSNWLCPNKNSSFALFGKYTSIDYSFLTIDVNQCGSINKNANCASPAQIDEKLKYLVYFSVYYVNTLITPSKPNPISYYLEDKDYIAFGKNLGAYGYISFSDYQISTDQSILPYTNIDLVKGGFVQLPTIISVQQTSPNWYSSFVYKKATNKYEYTRSYTKFDFVVSYTGGLFGAIMGVLFLMNHYTKLSFEIVIGSNIYNDDENRPIKIKSLNFFRYIGFLLYQILKSMGCPYQSQLYTFYQNCRQEIQKTLDIKLILQKLIFLERSVNTICGDHKFKALHLRGKCTLAQAKYFREMFDLQLLIKDSISQAESNKYKTLREKIKDNKQDKIKETPQKLSLKQNGRILPNIIVNGRICPLESLNQNSPNQDSIRPLQTPEQTSNEQPTKAQKINQSQKSDMCGSQILTDSKGKYDDELMKSLQQVKKQADSGDCMSMTIWNSIDRQLLPLIENRIRNRSFWNFGGENGESILRHTFIRKYCKFAL